MRKINLQNTSAQGKESIKQNNQRLILNLIREQQPVSRVEISQQTKMQKSTVTVITTRLLDGKWIYEGESAKYGGGRRPTNLYLNPKKYHAIGVEVSKDESTLALADLNGTILGREYLKTKTSDPRFFASLAQRIQNFAEQSVASTKVKVAGVGIGLPGYIEKATGRIIAAENFGWIDVPAGAQLRKRLNIPIYFENTAKLAAFSEIWFGDHKNNSLRNIVYITTRDGLGTSIIINGEIYNGARDGAAEFGHMPLYPDGEPCVCGNHGCWEVYASDMATVKRYIQELNRSKDPVSKPEDFSIRDVIRGAQQGQEVARNALRETAKHLGLGIVTLIFGFNPERVILGDELVHAWEFIEEDMLSTVRSRVPSYYMEGLKITPSSVSEMPSLLGAIALVLAKVFSLKAT
jgi:predicted NBD/HSP70 family sugar kinase